jgi:hypothetical protein
MAQDWRCRLRLHRYREKRTDGGEVYFECSRCGTSRFPDSLRHNPPEAPGGGVFPGGEMGGGGF